MIRHLGGSLLSDTPKWIWIWFHHVPSHEHLHCIPSNIPMKSLSAWWRNNHLEKWWSSSMGRIIPYEMENNPVMFETTNQLCLLCSNHYWNHPWFPHEITMVTRVKSPCHPGDLITWRFMDTWRFGHPKRRLRPAGIATREVWWVAAVLTSGELEE